MHLFSIVVLVVIVIVLVICAVIAFVIGLAIWSGLCTGGVFLLRPKGKRWPWLVTTIPLFVPAYLFAVVALVWIGWPDKQDHFEYAFDMPVPATVQIYEAQVEGWGDFEDTYLHFSATSADIRALTARGLALNPTYGAQQAGPFVPPNGSGTILWSQLEVYTGGSPNQRFGSLDEARLVYHPSTGKAWYWYDGID